MAILFFVLLNILGHHQVTLNAMCLILATLLLLWIHTHKIAAKLNNT